MDRVLVIVIILIGVFRWASSRQANKSYLLVSVIVQTLPLAYGYTLVEFLSSDQSIGEFGNGIRLEVTSIFSIILILSGFTKLPKGAFTFRENKMIYLLLFFFLIAIVNPANPFRTAVLVPFSFLVQMLFLLKLIDANFSRAAVLRGVFDGLFITMVMQFILCMLYPVMGLTYFSTLFRGESALKWAERREGYTSAIGTFKHPSHMALFTLIAVTFFFSCYFNHYQRRRCLQAFAMAAVIIFLSYSRTTYIVTMAVVAILFVVRRGRGIFTPRIILRSLLLFSSILFVLYFTPLSELFLKSDSEVQVENRMIHWALGYESWRNSPYFGIGVNAHVFYMSHVLNFDPFGGKKVLDFFLTNPIHNIHLIVLVETGAIGLIVWICFFFGSIGRYSKSIRISSYPLRVFNLMYVGILISYFLYGFFGWAPFDASIFGTAIFLGHFALDKKTYLRKAVP